LQNALPELYTRYLLDQNPAIFGRVLQFAADHHNLPMVFHCTAGKDRTGLAAALLLLALGVPEETVIADYTLSNRAYPSLLKYAAQAARPLRFFGIRAEDLTPLLVADAQSLRLALDHLKTKYGSVEAYLRHQVSVDAAVIEKLKANLLE
jgi:protein-tyrosine phosphatase